MPHIDVLGFNTFYRDEGAGPAVLLGHSSTASSGQWRALIARLRDRFRVLAPDHVGYGETAAHANCSPLVEHELAIIDALLHVAGEPAHLVGHSYGGALLLRAAARTPARVQSLTLIEPALFHLLADTRRLMAHCEIWNVARRVVQYADLGAHDEAARGFVDYWGGRGTYDAMNEDARVAVAAGMPKVRNEWDVVFDPHETTPDLLTALTMPILLVAGSNTTPAARGVIDALRDIWPQAAYSEIAGAGHMAPMTHADCVNDIVETFLGGTRPCGDAGPLRRAPNRFADTCESPVS
jgi:pimeloyl-ACP methyl ester carboxylesterase